MNSEKELIHNEWDVQLKFCTDKLDINLADAVVWNTLMKKNNQEYFFYHLFLMPGFKKDENLYLKLSLACQDDERSSGRSSIRVCKYAKEEIALYNLNPEGIISGNFKEWVSRKYSECLEILENEMHIIRALQFKPKFLFASVYQALFNELIRVKEYIFSLSDITNKRLIKEFKTYILSFLMTLKFYNKIFL